MDIPELPFEFPSNDALYLEWLDTYSAGFVLNSNRSLSASHTVVHHIRCTELTHSTSDEPGAFTEREYRKVYGEDVESLERWLKAQRADGSLRLHDCTPRSRWLERRFVPRQTYTKQEIYDLCAVPDAKQGGNWDTGYVSFAGVWFIFCNVGDVARTGHDYGNRFDGDYLVWYGKTQSHADQPSIRSMLDHSTPVLVFYREHNRDPFTFRGRAKAVNREGTKPICITWAFDQDDLSSDEVLAQEVAEEAASFVEGAVKRILVNAYERNSTARRKCIARYGLACSVCGFNFKAIYGDIGATYIQVHHLKPLSRAGGAYELDPIEDLRPVCANCHAMLHQHDPPFSIAELVEKMEQVKRSRSSG